MFAARKHQAAAAVAAGLSVYLLSAKKERERVRITLDLWQSHAVAHVYINLFVYYI